MAIKIRLTRTGRKKAAYFRLVVADSRYPRDGRVIEYLGRYQPLQPNDNLKIKEERALYWLDKGAIPTDTARSLLRRTGLLRQFHELRHGPSVKPGHEKYHQAKEKSPEAPKPAPAPAPEPAADAPAES